MSHGCVRTERAQELAITLAILGNLANTPETRKAAADEAVAISTSGKYTRVPISKSMPVYITYFTMGRDINGKMRAFADIYGRDAPVLASFDAPRVANRARKTSEEVVEIVDDLQDHLNRLVDAGSGAGLRGAFGHQQPEVLRRLGHRFAAGPDAELVGIEQTAAREPQQRDLELGIAHREAPVRAAELAVFFDVLGLAVARPVHHDRTVERVRIGRIAPFEPDRSAELAGVPAEGHVRALASCTGTRVHSKTS